MRRAIQIIPWVVILVLATALLMAKRPKSEPASIATPSHATATVHRQILYYVDPMHPAYKADKPGKAPDCGMDLVPVYEDRAPATAPATVAGYTTVTITPERQQLIGVKLGRAKRQKIASNIRTTGRVTLDETRLRNINTKFDGYIERLFVNYTGKSVAAGQPLLSIYSPELVATQREYLLAYRARKQLGSSSDPTIANTGDSLLQSARSRLLLWDMTASQISQLERNGVAQKSVTIFSPVTGFVQTKNAVEGARVNAGDQLYQIADLSRVWVMADVYESELGKIHVGQRAAVTTGYTGGRVWNGTVSFVAPDVDPMTRTVKVRVDVPNGDRILKPDMFTQVALEHGVGESIVVPESAVMKTGTRSIVFVATDGGRFEPRIVETGSKTDDVYEIRSGLADGEQIVLQANFVVDSESRLKAALAEMGGGGNPHAGHGQ